MENCFIVNGGKPLKGEVQLSGAKNVALKVAIASLLFDSPVTLTNIPHIKDINELLHILISVGVRISFEKNTLTIDPSGLYKYEIDLLHASKTRVSFMLFAPFLYRFGKAKIPNPGGCRIGARPINRQIEMMKAFGIDIFYDSSTGYYDASFKKIRTKSVNYTFTKPTHTGTELAIFFGLITDGRSIINNPAQEPEIDDLINFLNQSGADIIKKNNSIIINGNKKLTQKNDGYRIMYDRNEAPTYAIFALSTKGDILIKDANSSNLEYFISEIKKINGGFKKEKAGLRFFYQGKLNYSHIITKPHPGFMTDWQSPWAVLMTQANGASTIHETVFESRFGYVPELRKLGAKIEFYSPQVKNPQETYQFDIINKNVSEISHQAIKIYGPVKLHGGVVTVTDMRAGASLLVAATTADGESVILGASEIDRGYEKIEEKLKALGGNIKRL